jgi:hypothetical protein
LSWIDAPYSEFWYFEIYRANSGVKKFKITFDFFFKCWMAQILIKDVFYNALFGLFSEFENFGIFLRKF